MRCLIEFAFNLQCVVGATQILPTALWSLFFMKDVPWFDGIFSVGRDWKLWSYPRFCYIEDISGKKFTRKSKWWYVGYKNKRWYMAICVNVGGKQRTLAIHRLVALTHIPNPDNLPMINHKNWITDDNRVENLEWCTAKENNLHKFRVLKRYHLVKPVAQYLWDKLIAEYACIQDAAIFTKAHPSKIWSCANKRKWYKTARWFIWKFI